MHFTHPGERAVAGAKRAVDGLVAAEVGDVERREQHEAVAVGALLDPPGRLEDLGEKLGVGDPHQGVQVTLGETLEIERPRQDIAHWDGIMLAP